MIRSLTTQARVILSGAAWGPTQWGQRSEGSAFAFQRHWRVPQISLLSGVPGDRSLSLGRLRHVKAQATQARVILSGAAWGPTQWGKRSEGSAFVLQHHWRVPHGKSWPAIVALLLFFIPAVLPAQQHFNGAQAYEYARSFAAIGPRWPTGPGHVKAEQFIRDHFKHDQLEEDTFTANTAIGPVTLHNFIVRFPGKKDGVIVLGTHYETNYPLRNINFVGANDGAATTGLLMAIADQLRGKKLDGYSVWLVFFDGEEAFQHWSASDSTYGSRHLAAKWGGDGTLGRIKAFMLADMIGDKDLDIQREITFHSVACRTGAAGRKEIRRRTLLLPIRRSGG